MPYELTPGLEHTTLLWSLTPLVYGTGEGLNIGSGVPPINNFIQHFFTGRSDGFDPKHNSGDPNDARFDTEGICVSNDDRSVFISDEYGPYVCLWLIPGISLSRAGLRAVVHCAGAKLVLHQFPHGINIDAAGVSYFNSFSSGADDGH